jgi:hypothetical protein
VFKPERWMHLLQAQQQQQQSSQVNAAQQPQAEAQEGACPFSSSDAPAQQQQQMQGDSGACPYGSNSSGSTGSSSSSSTPAGYSFSSVLRELGPNGAYVPFGGGPRNCIGTGFAMTEAVLVLALLLQRYELQPVSPAAGFPRPKPMLTLRPEAVNLRVIARQQQQAQAQVQKPAQQQQQGAAVAAARAPVGA